MLCQFIVSMLYIYLQVVYRAYVKQENSTSNQKNLQMRGVGIETKKKKRKLSNLEGKNEYMPVGGNMATISKLLFKQDAK